MPALPSTVSTFLTKVINDLSVGPDIATPGNSNIRAAAMNYLRAQDMATVLELLQDALSNTYATGTLTFTNVAVADETVTIGGVVYTWKAAPSAAYEVDVGGTAAACVTNLVAAINASGTPGTEYGVGTLAHPYVTAADGAGDTVVVTAKDPGAVGNLATTEAMTNASWGGAVMTGGSDGVALTSTATGTTTVFVDGAGTFVPGRHVGSTFTFGAATTTAALRSVSRTVIANDDRTLTFDSVLPGTPASGDVGVLVQNSVDPIISELRGAGKILGDAPAGNVYNHTRSVMDALVKLKSLTTSVAATSTLTFTDVAVADETVTIGDVVYTWKAAPSAANEIDVGVDAATCVTNLVATIMDAGTEGTTYGTGTVANPYVTAVDGAGDTVVVTAKIPGASGNSIVIGETMTNASWTAGGTLLTGGVSGALSERNLGHPSLLTAAGSTTTVVKLNNLGVSFRVDEFKGAKVVVGTNEPRTVVSSDADSITVNKAFASAPSVSTAVSITVPSDVPHKLAGQLAVHPGGQPGENYMLASLIGEVRDAVVAVTLPV